MGSGSKHDGDDADDEGKERTNRCAAILKEARNSTCWDLTEAIKCFNPRRDDADCPLSNSVTDVIDIRMNRPKAVFESPDG